MADLGFFRDAFHALTGYEPLSWQKRLFKSFVAHRSDVGALPTHIDIPTGLGKTSVIVLWLLALAEQASPGGVVASSMPALPRRLVYVVDRRTIVDQATEIVNKIRCKLQAPDGPVVAELARRLRTMGVDPGPALAVSTLRGALADNMEWLADPSKPAVIIGTVDMIGSRLGFSGYRVSPKMRPFHAALLGRDALLVHDEAHLVPAFEAFLRGIERMQADAGETQSGKVSPRFHVVSLTATRREEGGSEGDVIFRLIEEDRDEECVRKRLGAEKRLTPHLELDGKQKLPNVLTESAVELATCNGAARILVYCDSRADAQKTKQLIDAKLIGGKKKDAHPQSELMVGQRRVREREKLRAWLDDAGFLSERASPAQEPTFLIATAAGEVGVDLDADHLVCDLVPWERMVQRLGRVNRRGNKQARVEVFQTPPKAKKPAEPDEPLREAMRAAVAQLAGDASPAHIERLKNDPASAKILRAAQSPAPLRPALAKAHVEAWSLTSLKKHPGRPEIAPWLRGWIEEEAQTTIIWRRHLPCRQNGAWSTAEINAFFEAAPPQTSETLDAETWRVAEWLLARASSALDAKAKARAALRSKD